MRIRAISRLIGQLIMIYAAILLLPFAYSCLEGPLEWSFLLVSILGLALGGGLFTYGEKSNQFFLRDSYLVVASTWVATAVLGALPFMGAGYLTSPVDALFESISGITATGASVIANVDGLPQSFILWRSIMHWLGGMGIIVLVLAVFRNLRADSAYLFKAEASMPRPGAVLPRIRTMATELWGLYVGFSLLCFALLWLVGGLSPFHALNVTMSTISTGGFLPTSDGVFNYHHNYLVMTIIGIFMVIGGGNFALYYSVKRLGLGSLLADLEFKVYIGILLLGGFLIGSSLWMSLDSNPIHAYANGLFMYISMQTGTGFAIGNYDQWPNFAQMILFLSTFIGGCSGSTAGAIKVFRFIVMFKSIGIYLRQSIHPNQVQVLRLNGRVMQSSWIRRIWQFFFAYMTVYGVSTLVLTLSGLSYTEALECTSATLSNVGLSFGRWGPTVAFDTLPSLAKLVCIVDMVLGRLEIFTVLVVLHPDFWSGYFIKPKNEVTRL